MSASHKLANAAQMLALLGARHADAPERSVSARELADCIDAPHVVIRRLGPPLVAAGMLASRFGRAGGLWLTRPVETISLEEVALAVDEVPSVGLVPSFAGESELPSLRSTLQAITQAASQASLTSLARVSVASLLDGA